MEQGNGDRSVFAATTEVAGDHVTVLVSGEVDMATAGSMFQAATRDGARSATLDLRDVSFFDSSAIQALVRVAERYPGALTVLPSDRVRQVLDLSGLGGQPWLVSRN